MADIELVIKIPKAKYLYAKSLVNGGKENNPVVLAIGNGVPLPKGHGRLIEVTNQLEQELFTFQRYTGIDEAPYESATIITDNAPTIINADNKEGKK